MVVSLLVTTGSASKYTHNESQMDSIYYLVVLDIIEESDDGKYQVKYNLLTPPERDVIEKQVKRYSSEFVSGTSCLKAILTDSVARRDEKAIANHCIKCGLKNKLVIVDASWVYLSKEAFHSLELMNRGRGRGMTGPVDIIGTWWTVRILIFDPITNAIVYNATDRYTQNHNVKPMKGFPGINHRRFFKRSFKKMKKFLANSKP